MTTTSAATPRACDACRRGLLCLRCNTGLGYIERMGDMAARTSRKQRHSSAL
jgi:hypothetical protein